MGPKIDIHDLVYVMIHMWYTDWWMHCGFLHNVQVDRHQGMFLTYKWGLDSKFII